MWSVENDSILKSLVLDVHLFDWEALANHFHTTIADVKLRWRENIYPTMRSNRKIAGAYVWT